MGVHHRVLLMAGVGGWVISMSAKIIRTLGDVGVPSFWLDPTVTGACPWGGGARYLRDSPFLVIR